MSCTWSPRRRRPVRKAAVNSRLATKRWAAPNRPIAGGAAVGAVWRAALAESSDNGATFLRNSLTRAARGSWRPSLSRLGRPVPRAPHDAEPRKVWSPKRTEAPSGPKPGADRRLSEGQSLAACPGWGQRQRPSRGGSSDVSGRMKQLVRRARCCGEPTSRARLGDPMGNCARRK
jgi:hypothetical protein